MPSTSSPTTSPDFRKRQCSRPHPFPTVPDRPGPPAIAPRQWPSEAEFVTIRVGQVEEPLAPFGITRIWSVTGRDHVRMEGVNVRVVKDNTSPPGPIPLDRLGDEIEITCSSPKARKRRVLTTISDFKSQHAIEANGTWHIVGGQRDGTNALDHRRMLLKVRTLANRVGPEPKTVSTDQTWMMSNECLIDGVSQKSRALPFLAIVRH
jgi:hypothetical protein